MIEGAGGDGAGSPGAEPIDAEEGDQGVDHEDIETDRRMVGWLWQQMNECKTFWATNAAHGQIPWMREQYDTLKEFIVKQG